MSVDLRGREVRVPQELLNRPQVGSSFEQVGGVRVAQDVGVQGPAIGQRMAFHDPPGVAR
jgi:hypothetical protein